jgi:predicted CoA-binding protein
MNHDFYTDDYITEILTSARTIAMMGASTNKIRPSYFAMKYLLSKGYTVHPVNPGSAGQKLLGQTVYGSLAEVPGPVDIVDIFRNAEAAAGIVADAVALREKLNIKVIWMQLSVRNDAAAVAAEQAGMKVVMNRCPKIEYGRLCGELNWFGVYSGGISSIAPRLSPLGVDRFAA